MSFAYIPLNARLIAFVEDLAAAVAREGIPLTADEALDLTGHLWSDNLLEIFDDPADWHVIWWERETAQTGEIVSVARSRAEAVAGVMSHAQEEGHELDDLETDTQPLEIYCEGELYARIAPLEFVQPRADLLKRMQTLLAPIKISDERTLVRRLMELPAWTVEPYNDFDWSWSKIHVIPVGTPRAGEWLKPISFTHGNRDKWPERKGREEQTDLEFDWEANPDPTEQNLQPMWPTPQNLAKLLQSELAHKMPEPPKLSWCQETLAKLLHAGSWNSLVARFNAHAFVQVTMSEVVDTEHDTPEVLFYESPAHLLACVYGRSEDLRAAGRPGLYISVSWLSSPSISLRAGERPREEIETEVAAKCVSPGQFDMETDEHRAASDAWVGLQQALRARSHQLRAVELLYVSASYRDEELEAAEEALDNLV
ncbi:hypothetical protein LJR175_008266 [Variovorax sp. LjRoot175]|uniref:hypothetical protein n=1 Tax=Variovorax sp. LjRoot175 TaxID=3342276 RepID=UPI003ECED336